MHVPDGFLDTTTALVSGAVGTAALGLALRHSRDQLLDRQIPAAGMTAAFVFAAQMVNFPVAAGTSGHLLGGVLAAVLLGPSLAMVAISVVVLIQALAFADGGLSALGINLINMGVVPTFGGYAVFVGLRRLFPATGSGVASAAGLAAFVSVPMSAMAFSLQWLFGATAPVPFDTVFGAMVGVHVLIGIGEGVLTLLALGAILGTRPDLVHGARHLDRAAALSGASARINGRTVALGSLLVAVLTATVVSQFAASTPDGLERVADNEGFAATATDHALDSGLFASYATGGIDNATTSLAVAGVTGVLLCLAVSFGLLFAVRDRRSPGQPAVKPMATSTR